MPWCSFQDGACGGSTCPRAAARPIPRASARASQLVARGDGGGEQQGGAGLMRHSEQNRHARSSVAMPSPACTVACAASVRSAAPPTRPSQKRWARADRAPVGRKISRPLSSLGTWGSRLLLVEKEPGGGDASVARVGDCSLCQRAGVPGVENICLRQQLPVLRRRQPRPRIRDADRRFWVLACRWFAD
jgi:hypothetical protein